MVFKGTSWREHRENHGRAMLSMDRQACSSADITLRSGWCLDNIRYEDPSHLRKRALRSRWRLDDISYGNPLSVSRGLRRWHRARTLRRKCREIRLALQ